jgi:HTH-type transcriptional regulator/antitoxin MqsA
MKCPLCAVADLVRDTRDLPYTYKGETTLIPEVTGDFCPACGEVIPDARLNLPALAPPWWISTSK